MPGCGRDHGHAGHHRIAGPAPVLILTTFDLDEIVHGALQAGADGFLLGAPPLASSSTGSARWRRAARLISSR